MPVSYDVCNIKLQLYAIDLLGQGGSTSKNFFPISYMLKTKIRVFKVERKANIRNGYNQVPHLTLDTIWESDYKKQER